MEIIGIFWENLLGFDWIIFVMAGINVIMYIKVLDRANRVYSHFNAKDQIANLNEEAKKALKENTKKEKHRLTANELLKYREKMNKYYALYSNLTTMFPLLGMLGTVVSLIPMVNSIGAAATESFFAALTSTFWGIIAALIFKGLDASVSYKIEDNEKHMEYIFNPNRKS
ncbi:MAG: MotA/TolQ/ExbB proton channel family protein [Lachnospiraceae bacterium]|nr:MotA/TolQ/ExbB proton channel family protein [Lachnospiraceae bacterium]